MSDEKSPSQSEGWKQWSQHAKESMEKLEKKVDKLEDKITNHREENLVEISTLKAKAGIMGMIAGFVVSTVMSIIIGLLVWQLTTGSHLSPKPHEHEVGDNPETIGYMLPPRENHNNNIVVVKEGDV